MRSICKIFFLLALLPGVCSAAALQDPYGICTHLSRSEWQFSGETFQALRQLGCRWIRTDFDWAQTEPTPGRWEFRHLDRLCAAAQKEHVNILPILDYDVPWAAPAWKNLDRWKHYVRTVVSRYPQLSYWEVWNEPNLPHFWPSPNPEHYALLLKETYTLLKQLNPSIKVLYAGTAGIPYPFIEASLKAGAGNFFDIMNIHPYNWQSPPEVLLHDLRKLRRLMRQYQIADKPIWITEVSWSTAGSRRIFPLLLPRVLQKIGCTPDTPIAVIHDPDRGISSIGTSYVKENLDLFRNITYLKLEELEQLDPKNYPLLVPSVTEGFPMAHFPQVLEYVRRGGTLLLSGGLPFYYDLRKNSAGTIQKIPVGDRFLKQLHVSWKTRWTTPEVPAKESWQRVTPEFSIPTALPFAPCSRFLTSEYLQQGDQLLPIIEAGNDKFHGMVAALYRLDSDLQGNVIVYTGTAGTEVTTETAQAEMLGRLYLIALSEGVERIFWFNLRSSERNPYNRDDFLGLVHADFTPKPSFLAYKTLREQLPPGSSRPELSSRESTYIARWIRPDRQPVFAVWSLAPMPPKLKISGRVSSVTNHLGESVRPSPIVPGSGILFIRGADQISFQ